MGGGGGGGRAERGGGFADENGPDRVWVAFVGAYSISKVCFTEYNLCTLIYVNHMLIKTYHTCGNK